MLIWADMFEKLNHTYYKYLGIWACDRFNGIPNYSFF